MSASAQYLRRTAQTFALLLAVGVPLLAAHRVAHPGRGSEESALAALAAQVQGNTWSLKIGPLSLTDLLAGAESLAAGKAPAAALLVGLAIPLVLALLAGRVFCAWICPAGFLLEGVDNLRTRIGRLSGSPRDIRFWRGNKYILLTVGLLLSAAFSFPLLSRFYPPALLAGQAHQWLYGTGAVIGWGALFLGGIAAVELLVARRMWCRHFCPGGALHSLLGARRLVRVTPPDERCDRCGKCGETCGMGLDPMRGATGLECDNCLRCVDVCPAKALHLRLSVGKVESGGKSQS